MYETTSIYVEMAEEVRTTDDIKATNGIGEKIVRYRKANGISQTYLAARIGISKQGLLKIEKGQSSPRVSTIRKILEVLCITPNQLFGLEEMTEENFDILRRITKSQAE